MPADRGRAARAATLAQVAAAAGVSPATASFVLSGRGGKGSAGSEETKQRVREAAEQLGYVPNRYARAMRTGRSDAIVLALGTVGDPWGISLTRAVRERALPRDLATVVLADERWYEYLSGFASDCAFVTGVDASPEAADQVRRLSRSGTEIVAFSERIEPEGFDVVRSSALPAVGQAYRMLRARHDVVSFLSPVDIDPGVSLYAPVRARAFVEAAQTAGDERSAASRRAVGRGHGRSLEACRQWLEQADRPTAVVCSTGYLALALQAAAAQRGISVPEELEIVSIGDVPAEAQFFDDVSYFGVQRVFARIADLLVERATTPGTGEGTLHEFAWEFFPGATTRA